MVMGSLETRISDSESSFFFSYKHVCMNQSRNREWGKEDEGIVLLSGIGGGAGCIGDISRFHVR